MLENQLVAADSFERAGYVRGKRIEAARLPGPA
jgi:hypothetical protein